MKLNPTILKKLQSYSETDAVAMHMPGHKRNVDGYEFLEALSAKYDITEIDGFDNLHKSKGLIREAEDRAAGLWGSDHAFFLINGSSCGNLAAIRAAKYATGSSTIIMARNCHISVYNAVELCSLEPLYLEPEPVKGFGFCGSISPKDVEIAVKDNPNTPVILTSPTYEGVISNIAEIAIICHMYGCPLIVDEAHGSHLDLSKHFTGGAVSAGADIVVQSIHKTLTGLTQSAILHLNGALISADDLNRQLSIFESTSPSYILMAGLDGTVDLVAKQGKQLFNEWKANLEFFDTKILTLQNLIIPGHSDLFECQRKKSRAGYSKHGIESPSVWGYDRSKIVITCEGTNVSGVELMEEFRSRYHIECEMASYGYVTAMTGILTKRDEIERLANAICELDSEIHKTVPRVPLGQPKIPPYRVNVAEAIGAKKALIPIRESVGKISADYVFVYPPGIPIVVPGEELTEDAVRSITVRHEAGMSIRGSSSQIPEKIHVLM